MTFEDQFGDFSRRSRQEVAAGAHTPARYGATRGAGGGWRVALAAGGDDRNASTLTSVEAYDPQQNRWEAVASMSSTHDFGAVAAL